MFGQYIAERRRLAHCPTPLRILNCNRKAGIQSSLSEAFPLQDIRLRPRGYHMLEVGEVRLHLLEKMRARPDPLGNQAVQIEATRVDVLVRPHDLTNVRWSCCEPGA